LEHTKFSLHILPDRLLLFCKHTLCLFYRFANCLHKCGLGRIDTIWEIVPFVIRVTIDLIGHLWSMSFYKPREKWRSMKHIDIIVRVGHAEERVSYPEILWRNRLKYDRAPFYMDVVLPLPCKLIVLTFPVHVIDASKHTRKASWLTDWQYSSNVGNIWFS
jgi:hypothetical protein